MVNVGGRSRGCSTCRRRRVKCDEAQPICKRCENGSFECSGTKPITFIEQGGMLDSGLGGRNRTRRGQKMDKITTFSFSRNPEGSDAQIYIAYARQHLLRDGPVGLTLRTLRLSDIQAANDSMSGDFMLHRAILSISVIFFGSQRRMKSVRNHGLALYGLTLRQLNQVLSKPDSHNRDDVLISVVSLALLEFFFPTGRKYYQKHMIGLERILELRGPVRCYDQESFEIYGGIRRLILFSSLSRRKASILAREEWKSVPWKQNTSNGQPEGILFNALADVTTLFLESDQISSDTEMKDEHCQTHPAGVKQRALHLLDRIWAAKKKWNDTNKRAQFEASASIVPMLYHTALIYVLQSILSLSPHPSRVEERYAAATQGGALKICHDIPYFLSRNDRLDTGTLIIGLLAVKSSISAFGDNNPSARGCIMKFLESTRSGVSARGLWEELT